MKFVFVSGSTEGEAPRRLFHLQRESAQAGMCGGAPYSDLIPETSLGRQCSRPSVTQGARFFTYSLLIIKFKGILMTLKNVVLAIVVEQPIFTIFFDVLLLSYKPSNFAGAILPYDVG